MKFVCWGAKKGMKNVGDLQRCFERGDQLRKAAAIHEQGVCTRPMTSSAWRESTKLIHCSFESVFLWAPPRSGAGGGQRRGTSRDGWGRCNPQCSLVGERGTQSVSVRRLPTPGPLGANNGRPVGGFHMRAAVGPARRSGGCLGWATERRRGVFHHEDRDGRGGLLAAAEGPEGGGLARTRRYAREGVRTRFGREQPRLQRCDCQRLFGGSGGGGGALLTPANPFGFATVCGVTCALR
mmetsp:Transcript_46199/g.142459  ORF Transcript_46199/g.142459 Transcript_46199/m.142459 type:complete len:238 (+) Transcript_46199:130-843(+)